MSSRRRTAELVACIVLATAGIATGAVPDGFAVYSKGDWGARTLHKVTLLPGWSESQIKGSEQTLCDRGSLGGSFSTQGGSCEYNNYQTIDAAPVVLGSERDEHHPCGRKR